MNMSRENIKEFFALFLQHGLVIILGLALLVQCEEKKILIEDSKSKDEYIDKLIERDSLYKVYMGADSTGTFVYSHIGDSVISYRALLDRVDKLDAELKEQKRIKSDLEDSLWVKSSVIKMLDETLDFSYNVTNTNGKMTVRLSLRPID